MTSESTLIPTNDSPPLESTESAENDHPHLSDGVNDSDASEEPDIAAGSGQHEAAKYRRRLRATEAERDILATQVEELRKAEILRLAGENLSVPGDIFTLGGAAISDLLDDAGMVDREKVSATVDALIGARPGLHVDARRPYRPTHMNYGQGAGQAASSRTTTWQSALSGR